MPLLKRSTADAESFRSVVHDENALIVRDGAPWDESAEPRVREFPDEQHAKHAYDDLLAALFAEGWKVVEEPEVVEEMAEGAEEPGEEPAVSAANPALERAVERAMEAGEDDEKPLLVYGDWLQSKGDPRGALMSVQHALESAGDGDRRQLLLDREKELLDSHRHALLRDFAEYPLEPFLQATWRRGFLERAELRLRRAEQIEETLVAFLDLPVCRFLRELSIPEVAATSYDEDEAIPTHSFRAVVEVLGFQTRIATLRSLALGSVDDLDLLYNLVSNREVGPVAPLLTGLPGLRSLAIAAGSFELQGLAHDRLESLSLFTGSLSKTHLEAVRTAHLPKLTALTLGIGDLPPARDGVTMDDLEWILVGDRLPRVRHLGLVNALDADGLCSLIASSRIVKQLESLDLSFGGMTDEGLEALGEAKKQLKHLKRIELTDNPELTDEGVEQLAGDLPGCEIVRREIHDTHDWGVRWSWERQPDEM